MYWKISSFAALIGCIQANSFCETKSVGDKLGEKFSNIAQIEELGSDKLVMKSFKTCENGSKNLIGVQFTIVDQDDEANEIELEPIGVMSGNCRSLTVEGSPIDKVKASFNQNKETVSGIRYFKGENFVEYGTVLNPFEQWIFNEQNQMIGVQGYVD